MQTFIKALARLKLFGLIVFMVFFSGVAPAASQLDRRAGPPSAPANPSINAVPIEDSINPFCQNLLADHSFEESVNAYLSGAWAQYSNQFATPLCGGENFDYCGDKYRSHTGKAWAGFGGKANVLHQAWLRQTIVIPVGEAWLDFYLWVPSVESGSGADDYLRVSIGGTEVFRIDALEAQANPFYATDYRRVRTDASAFADGAPHVLEIYSVTSDQVVDFLVDDVYLCPGTPPVETYLPVVIAP